METMARAHGRGCKMLKRGRTMAAFLAGFARVDVTPPLGIEISGYFMDRFAAGVLDALEASAVAVACGESRAVVIGLDNLMIDQTQMDVYRRAIAEKTGLAYEGVFICCSHTHTGPLVGPDPLDARRHGEAQYGEYLGRKLCDCAALALRDLQPSKLGWAVANAPRISFIRRFRMKDGSIRTNPGVNNPDILAPIGDVDERVNVLRFVREAGPEIIVANFGVHPDVIGGEQISADYPGFFRRTLEKALDNVRCVFLNGAEGDVNHVNVFPRPGEGNGLVRDFDDVDRGYAHARHMGMVLAGAVLQVYEKVHFTEPDCVKFAQVVMPAPSNMPTADEAARAEEICRLHEAGRDAQLPYEGMELTTVVAEALRMQQLKDGPESFGLYLGALQMGEVALLGIPGEPFTGVGRGIKDGSAYALTLPCSLTNGAEGYYPMREAYDEGGYEARSSIFKAGIAERIIDAGTKLLRELKNA